MNYVVIIIIQLNKVNLIYLITNLCIYTVSFAVLHTYKYNSIVHFNVHILKTICIFSYFRYNILIMFYNIMICSSITHTCTFVINRYYTIDKLPMKYLYLLVHPCSTFVQLLTITSGYRERVDVSVLFAIIIII